MEETVFETANKIKDLADAIKESVIEESFDDSVPGYVQDALLRLYYAIGLDGRLEKLQASLSEDTDEETVEAMMDAANAVEKASNAAYYEVEEYAGEDKEFREMIDGVTLNSEANTLTDLLYKLYKCESIIHMAYQCSMRHDLYGIKVGGLCAQLGRTAGRGKPRPITFLTPARPCRMKTTSRKRRTSIYTGFLRSET